MEPDHVRFHQDNTRVLLSERDQVRDLIGDAHWLSDGTHKEMILRKALRARLPDRLSPDKGFVIKDNRAVSTQLDIIIRDANREVLHRNDDAVFVSPECVHTIIEVKTHLNKPADVMDKLATAIGLIREAGQPDCRAGLFVFGGDETGDTRETNPEITDKRLLRLLDEAADGDVGRVINWVALGPHRFFRFWPDGSVVGSRAGAVPVWHSYKLADLAFSYFISNCVEPGPGERHWTPETERLWYPLPDGKERNREEYRALTARRDA